MSFREKIQLNEYVVTGEVAPPKGTVLDGTVDRAKGMAPYVDAVNVTDNQRGIMRMSNLAVAAKLVEAGIEPILQVTCRDRNRLGLQSDLMAAHALGIRNILGLTGDPATAGNQPDTKAVFDLSSAKLIEMAAGLNAGHDMIGTEIEPPTDFCLGGVVNPNLPKLTGQIRWMQMKIDAGAQFIQTQAVYDVEQYLRFRDEAGDISVPILGGILLLKSAKMARFLVEEVPGVKVPEEIINRLETAENPKEAGFEITLELAHKLAPHCDGLHLMSVGQERTLGKLAQAVREGLPQLADR